VDIKQLSKKMKRVKIIITMIKLLGCMFIFTSMIISKPSEKEDLTGYDIELFKNTPVWELAIAVKAQNTHRIKAFCQEHPSLIDYQEKKIGNTLLWWAVFNGKFKSAKALVIAGANPNIEDNEGETPFITAAGKYNDASYLKLLLAHGGNVNTVSKKHSRFGFTPLMAAASHCLESVKILVDAGADINYYDKTEDANALAAACGSAYNKIDILRYLIIEKGADFKVPILYRVIDNSPVYPLDFIKDFRFKPNSKEEKMKKEVIAYIEAHS
jgi:hypothetical protein